ncbi:Potassium voltage-gated channel subfamily H member 7 [Amphibalanus amphitrite]|uniref:Potassium voltage-gated channel subfamily H member 7 n=1 Tax=Amphibalanus amphitrite TaxID=1232801 RepID=A0A6A4WN73_AMPAM|nr:Potassium voltage-gated channel subfamily H member 7 [Amphibalanus amphitrite]
MPAIVVSPSENEVPLVSQSPTAEGSTDHSSKTHDDPEVSHSLENAGPKATIAKPVKSVSHQIDDDSALREMYVSSRPVRTSSAHIVPESSSGIRILSRDSGEPSDGKRTSRVSIGSVLSARSQFKPPVWLDTFLQRIRERLRRALSSNFIINPKSELLLLFNLLLAILGVTSIMILFYQLAFSDFSEYLNWILLVISLVYTVNIYIRMHTAYYDNYGDLVCDQLSVKKKYIREPTGLLIDVLSALPIGMLVFIHPGSPELLQAIHKVRFGQLARFYTVFNFFRSWEGLLKAPVLLLRSVRAVGFLLVLLHIWACFWYMAACSGRKCEKDSWITIRNLDNSTNHERYINAMYFITATMTSTGYGEIRPNTMQEVVVCIATIIIGKFAIGEFTRKTTRFYFQIIALLFRGIMLMQ